MDLAERHRATAALAAVLGRLAPGDRTQAVVAAYESGLVVPGRERG